MNIQTPNSTKTPLTYEQRRQQFIDQGVLVSIPLSIVPAHWLYREDQRLDASYYAQEVATALRIIADCDCQVKSLGEITSRIFILKRFRRIYAEDKNFGWPYLSASEAFEFRPISDRWLARDHAPKQAKHHFAKQGWILVSSSGTVGRTIIATKRLEKYFLTHDLIRVVPDSSLLFGYLYAFLSSQIGQLLISKDQYGSAIKHLEPHHLANIPIPLLPIDEQQFIHNEVTRAYTLREEVNNLLDEADEQLHQELRLPRFDKNLVQYLSPPSQGQRGVSEMPHPHAFTVTVSELDERLDASYHTPVVQTAVQLLHKGRYQPKHLGQLAERIYIPPRFKRIYVQKEYGLPFLRPSHLPHMRPHDLGYISRLTNVLESLILYEGEVLITTDGTVGRVSMVTNRINGWTGSNNIARVKYGTQDHRNGFLAAFLSTPYGFYQLTREIYGGVIDHIETSHIESVLLPAAPEEVQRSIGERVVRAFEKKDEATAVEEAAINRLEARLQQENSTSTKNQ